MGFEDSPAPKSSSLIRQLILGVILVLIAGAAVYEFKFVRPEVAEYQQKVVDNDNGFLGPADIQELMEREPAHKEEYEDGSLVETYSWQRPIPYMTHDLYAIYKKTVRNHENGESQTDYTFTKITNNLEGVELPGTQTFLIPELKQDDGMSTGFGGGGGGGGGRGRGRGQNNRAENNQQEEKKSDDKSDSTDKKESDENKSGDQSAEKADAKKSDEEKSDADKKAGDGSSKESEKSGEAGKSDEATKSGGEGDPEAAGKTAEKNNEAEKDESTKKDESEKKQPDPAK